MSAVEFNAADIDYIRANYRNLRDVCRDRGEDLARVLLLICLRYVSPDAIVRKSELVSSIKGLLAEAAPGDRAWQERLHQEVEELDRLERDFSPDYDRHRFGIPPSRDRLITAAHERYPEMFDQAAVRGR